MSPRVAQLPEQPPRSRPSVLLVDDRPANLLVLEALLEPLQARTVRAQDGREALRCAAQEDFAVILLDVRLPDLSGLEVTARLREHGLNRRTPVLLLTAGDVGEEELLRGYAHGAVDFLQKPLVPSVLQAKVSVFLELYLARETVREQEARLRVREREALESQHRELLGALLQQAPAAIAILRGPQRVFEFTNPLYEQVVGRSGLVGKPLLEAMPEIASQPAVLRALDGVMRTGETFVGSEFAVQLQRGEAGLEEVFFNLIYQAMREPDGQVSGVIAFAVDITDQVRARRRVESLAQAVREREERFRLLAETIPQLVWATGPDGTHDYFNQRFLEYTGATRERTDAGTWQTSMHPADREKALARWRHSVATGEPFEVEYRRLRHDGEWRWLLGRALPLRDPQGQVLRWLGTSTDIEDQVRTLRELERTQAQLARTARHDALVADLGILLTRSGAAPELLQGCTEALVRHLDAAFARIWLLDEAGEALVLQASAGLYTHKDGPHARVPVGQFKIGLIARERTPHLTNDVLDDPLVGDPAWARREGMVAFAGYPLLVGERLVGVMALFSRSPLPDQTLDTLRTAADTLALGIQRLAAEEEVRRLNQELEERVEERTAQLRESNRELESFSYSVSHDLRAPLRHVTGFAQLLQKRAGPQLDETSRGYLATIFEAAHQGGHLVDDLLAFSRMGRAELRRSRVPLRELVDEVVRELAPDARGRSVEWRVGALPEVQADPSMLRQVLRNLLANALKYSRPRSPAVIELGAERTGTSELHVWVKDNGVGFEMQYVDKLFGVFQRLHTAEQFEGTGIGLANVKRVISRHGGRVWAEGAPDQGATFHFTLPTAPPAPTTRTTTQ